MRRYLELVFERGVVRRSLVVAIAVGTALNVINQGDKFLLSGEISYLKAALTYAIPYCVATYGAVSSRLSLADRAH